MIDVASITSLHRERVVRWHEQEIDNPHQGLLRVVCEQFRFNFLLWHEEDVARSPDVGDERIAQVKRAIDGYNQQRNDWIERIDDWISDDLEEKDIRPAEDSPLNTETPGSVMDRLSIMALRIFHMEEQMQRDDATPEHLESVRQKLVICRVQHHDLSHSLQQLLDDIYACRKCHKTYRQFKMYNDPSLNPYLYGRDQRQAG